LKKGVPYILLTILILALVLLGAGVWHQKTFDRRVTLDKKSKIPYGTYVTHTLLPVMFPGCYMITNRESPVDWLSVDSAKKSNQLFFLLTQHFNPSRTEMLYLMDFVRQGNYVFISTPQMNAVAKRYLKVSIYKDTYDNSGLHIYADSVNTSLLQPVFTDSQYFNPGYTFGRYFDFFDTSRYEILGRDGQYAPNFIKVNMGKGSIYLHSDPFLFANYFLVSAGNKDYFEKALSVIPASVKKIIWDEYYVYKLNPGERPPTPSPLRVILSYPAFRWAFYTALAFLLLYLLLNMKRSQRMIPVVTKPVNDSLDFVKTIGRLYFEKQDHLNIAVKMAAYFLEHVRNRYLIMTTDLDDRFIQNLSGKSGYDEEETKRLIQSVSAIQQASEINEQQLAYYYHQFKQFYKRTT
jgi:hypothetical protein